VGKDLYLPKAKEGFGLARQNEYSHPDFWRNWSKGKAAARSPEQGERSERYYSSTQREKKITEEKAEKSAEGCWLKITERGGVHGMKGRRKWIPKRVRDI